MTDWMRFFSFTDTGLYVLSMLSWAVGGWLLVRGLFRLRGHERLLAGIASGWVLHLVLTNLLVQVLPMLWGNLLAAGLLLIAGLSTLMKNPLKHIDWSGDLRAWQQLIALALLTLLFESALRGFSLFDEYLHLPMVSIMGAGDIPPHFYGDANLPFAYHYGLHIFAALLTRLANFFPYTAWDLARGFSIALTALLGWQWVRRYTRSTLAGVLGSLLIMMGGGTRWLMLFLPASVLQWISAGVQMSNSGLDTGVTLVEALSHPWAAEGPGSVPLPFAYLNGVFNPQFLALGASSALPAVIVLLLVLLSRPRPSLKNPGGLTILTLMLAGLALSAEHLFAMLWAGICLALVLAWLNAASHKQRVPADWTAAWIIILIGSGLLSAVQGGYITVTLQSLLARLAGVGVASSYVYGFGLRWPPAVVNGHLGNLNLFKIRQLAALLFELGPVLLLAGLSTRLTWRAARRQEALVGGLGFASMLALVFTLTVQYGHDRESSRFAGTALWLWLVLCVPLLWFLYQRGNHRLRIFLGTAAFMTILSGIVIFSIQVTSIQEPCPTYFIKGIDQVFLRKYWNHLPPQAHVLDVDLKRAITVFGRASYGLTQEHAILPRLEALTMNPTPEDILTAGYTHIYMSSQWWEDLPERSRRALQAECVVQIEKIYDTDGDEYRQLLDVTSCK